MRHRAALGITEQSDAISLIVSEETGFISLAIDGAIHYNITPEELERLLTKEMWFLLEYLTNPYYELLRIL